LATFAAIGLAHHKYGGHCGVYYESAGGDIELLHLSLHNRLLSESPSAYYFNIPSRFAPREQIAISDYCRLVYNTHRKHGLRFSVTRTDAFDPRTAALLIDEPGVGFSCATFVKAIFDGTRLPLVDSKTWADADSEDRDWLLRLLAVFKGIYIYLVDQKHFAQVDVSCNWSRYKPEQIAFAASVAPPMATFKQVKKNSEFLMKKVRAAVAELPPVDPPKYYGPPAPTATA
jgi:hypothetical protein